MRILHTSDWHLGKTLHGLDLLPHQARFVDDLVAAVDAHNVDCVLIAGDIFDKGVPPLEAVRLYSDALTRLADHCAVVVTSGNHDSAIRLGAGSALFRAGVHVATDPRTVGDQFDLHVKGVHVRVYPIPYLDPDHCRSIFSEEEPLPRSHEAVMAAAVERIWQRDQSLAIEPDARIAIAHAFVAGGTKSDSERDISVGGIDTISSGVFAGFDYVALGHLHGPQAVAGTSTVRYSGSPLRYSFSESQHVKSTTIVDIDHTGVIRTDTVPISQPRAMKSFTGSFAELTSEPLVRDGEDAWVRVVVTDAARPDRLIEKVKQLYPHALSVIHEPALSLPTQDLGPSDIDLRDPVTVSAEFVADVTGGLPSPAEANVLRNAYDLARQRMRQ